MGKPNQSNTWSKQKIIYCHYWSSLGSVKPRHWHQAVLASCYFSSIPFTCVHNIGVESNNWTLSHKGAGIAKDTQENSLAEDQLPAGSHCMGICRGVGHMKTQGESGFGGSGCGWWGQGRAQEGLLGSARLESQVVKTANDPNNVTAE